MGPQVCVLGATGCIGFELTVHLLQAECDVLAAVRDGSKLQRMLAAHGMGLDLGGLSVVEQDLFTEGFPRLGAEVMACDYIFNAASKPISWVPWSRANREWGGVVSTLTRAIVRRAWRSASKPHIVAFCGPEHFPGYDDEAPSPLWTAMSKVLNRTIAALRDNHDEAVFLLSSGYDRWSVLRCGSIRPSSGEPGDASRIGVDLHRDGSDYRRGKGEISGGGGSGRVPRPRRPEWGVLGVRRADALPVQHAVLMPARPRPHAAPGTGSG